ncbi:SMI1/KNR4 family protein [Streptomyces abyssomicinicus]|uniref:SMI1/KNR4 family protein n=1 Tax=Streptomyces abyssomicinicus TaxID=574929 RepID=UPI00124FBBD7|nr:SMI1/KNR4 family protein [Streptomyces abyssomicinicus]
MSHRPSPVSAAWTRIDNWLRTYAPGSYENLSPPADPAAVEEAQAVMGLRFPDELLESLACHDGMRWQDSTFPVRSPRSVAAIVSFWRTAMDILRHEADDPEDEAPGDGAEPWWHPLWIPWAHGDGDAQIIDMREGPHQGRLGERRHDDCGHFGGGWPTLAAYLEEVADTLESGGTVGSLAPFLGEGYVDGMPELHWEVPDPAKRSRFSRGGVPAPVSRPPR